MGLLAVVVIVVVIVLFAGNQAKSRLREKYPPLGQMVDIGGYSLHLHSSGQGSPTVVMDAGAGGIGLHWALVQPEVAKFTRAVVYDRAGLGWSELSPKPRTSDIQAQELHTLLNRAGIPGPYVMVGHSFGGIVIRQFVQQYPNEVVGMVLVDSAHEEQFKRYPKPMLDMMSKMMPMMKVMNVLYQSGIPALRASSMKLDSRVPQNVGEIDRAVRAVNPKHMTGQMREFEVITQGRNAKINTLGNIPLIVLSHGKPQPMPNLPDDVNADYEKVWQEMQVEMTGLSSNSKRIIAQESGHDIQLEQPQLVIEAIREIVEAARKS